MKPTGIDPVGEPAVPDEAGDPVLERVAAGPDGPEPERVGREEQVLDRGRAVLDPEHLERQGPRVRTDQDAERRPFAQPAYGENEGIASSAARSSITTNCQGCSFAADGACMAALSRAVTVASSTGSFENRRTERRVMMASMASMVIGERSRM